MSNYSSIITSLNSKIEKLVFLHRSLEEEKMRLNAEKQDLLKIIQQLKTKNNYLEEQNKAIRVARDMTEEGESSLDLKLKINEMVREIDKCLALLNR
ncbi:MAG: hypothetical protein LC101_12430 [Flavobacteriales bacterium]|nr:hypothetical protein [Flavobacteriales bacterium]MCZ2444569.1 hypothetical protein [Flavobacteriales bacterium]